MPTDKSKEGEPMSRKRREQKARRGGNDPVPTLDLNALKQGQSGRLPAGGYNVVRVFDPAAAGASAGSHGLALLRRDGGPLFFLSSPPPGRLTQGRPWRPDPWETFGVLAPEPAAEVQKLFPDAGPVVGPVYHLVQHP